MADDSRKLSITYSFGISHETLRSTPLSYLIPPPEILTTLVVFYDEISPPDTF
jgi:hypothetical protein